MVANLNLNSRSCRGCLEQSETLASLTDLCVEQTTFLQAFEQCTQLEVLPQDGLPQALCITCCYELEMSYKFLHKAQQTHVKLNKLRKRIKVELDTVSVATADDYSADEDHWMTDAATDADWQEQQSAHSWQSSKSKAKIQNAAIARKIQIEQLVQQPQQQSIKVKTLNDLTEPMHATETVYIENSQTNTISSLDSDAEFNEENSIADSIFHGSFESLQDNQDKVSWLNFSVDEDEQQQQQQVKGKIAPTIQTATKPTAMKSTQKTTNNNLPNKQQNSNIHNSNKSQPQNTTGVRPRYKYQCSICSQYFRTNTQRLVHERIHTGETPYECDICDKKFRRAYALTMHKRIHTDDRPYACSICNKTFRQWSSMHNHKKGVHMSKPFKCTECDKEFVKQREFDEHVKQHTQEQNTQAQGLKCSICKETCANANALREHTKQHAQQNVVRKSTQKLQVWPKFVDEKQSDTMSETITDIVWDEEIENTLMEELYLGREPKHVREEEDEEDVEEYDVAAQQDYEHDGMNSFMNLEDEKEFKAFLADEDNAELQIAISDNMEQYELVNEETINWNESTFETNYDAVESALGDSYMQDNNDGGDEFDLSLYDTSNAMEQQQQQEQQPPSTQKLLTCAICNEKLIYKTTQEFNNHMKQQHANKNLLCTVCSKTFDFPSHLTKHMRSHTDERPYECRYCSARFKLLNTLKTHEAIHINKCPYKCQFCGKGFVQFSSMRDHEKNNHLPRDIDCQFCDKKFTRQIDLKRHLFKHTGEKPYNCHLCEKSYTTKCSLNSHLRSVHHEIVPIKNEHIYVTLFQQHVNDEEHEQTEETAQMI